MMTVCGLIVLAFGFVFFMTAGMLLEEKKASEALFFMVISAIFVVTSQIVFYAGAP